MPKPEKSSRRDLSNRQFRHQGKYANDPLVKLDRRRFRAAFLESPYAKRGGNARLARDLRAVTGRPSIKRQWVDGTLAAPSNGACRQSVFRAAAKLLDVPEAWLAGESLALPITAALRLGVDVEGLPDFPQIAPIAGLRLQLAKARLVDRCVAACLRDLARLQFGDDVEGGRESITYAILAFLASAVVDMTSARRWRQALVAPTLGGQRLTERERRELVETHSTLPPKAPPVTPAEMTVDIAYVRAFAEVLEPWFAGDQCLNYAALRRTYVGMLPSADIAISLASNSDDVRRRDGSRVHARDRFTPMALLRWASGAQSQSQEPSGVGESEIASLRDGMPQQAHAINVT